ncbi:MAG: PQQ-binding-like beta-propeller repeat protein [Vicinamibacteraceae bacterium]
MHTHPLVTASPGTPLRLWPGVWLGLLILVLRFVPPQVAPRLFEADTAMMVVLLSFLGALVASLLVLLWWLFFSRAPWMERLLALGLVALGFLAGPLVADRSITTGAMGMLYAILVIPIVALAFVAWAALTRHLATGLRRTTMAAAILLAFGSLALVRTGGFTASMKHDIAWRWTPTPEERLLAAEANAPRPAPATAPVPSPLPSPAASATSAPVAPPASTPSGAATSTTAALPAAAAPTTPTTPGATPTVGAAGVAPMAPAPTRVAAEWPGFRGPGRDGTVRGSRLATDWSATPPVALWRRAVGPGWSSFAVAGNRVYTQEQRGEDEVVACYDASTGAPIWQHRDRARFWESNGGAGPRGTPTLSGGRVYALGATGVVNALDAATGTRIWSRDAATDTGAKLPGWGFSGSPIVVDDVVVVAVSGALAAYDAVSGQPRWKLEPRGEGYSSPQLVTLGGVRQLAFVNGEGIVGVSLSDGAVLWANAWKGYPVVQPAVTADGDLLFNVKEDLGLRRLSVTRSGSQWTATERWTTRGLKPYFNDFVVHEGHAYGFDGNILACIDLADGTRKWKGGRYGNGQLVLLADQDALLVLGEEGELALVGATPDGFVEISRAPGLDGKTWNHPVVVGERLLVRNSAEMAAFRLPLASAAPASPAPPPVR